MKENYTYKNLEETSNTPHLRFPEFTGEWKEKKLGEVFDRIVEKNIENNKNVLTISAQYGLINQLDFFNKSVSASDVTGYYLLHKGDFAYNKSRSQGKPVGAMKPLKLYDKGCVSTLYICFRCKDQKQVDFWEQYFDAGMLDKGIQAIAQEGARNHGLLNISTNDFFDLPIIAPSPSEQQKIADCLSSLDDMISAEEQKTEALREYKRGLMQQLFPANGATTPQLRFPGFTGEWKEKKLGEIIVESKDVSTTENEDILLTSSIDGMFLNSEVFSHQRGSSTIGYRKIKKGMLVLSAQNLHLGNANVNLRFESGLVSPAYKVYDIVGCSSMFMGQWVKRESTKQLFLQATTQGASECRKNVVWEQLYQQKLLLPSSAEQQKIADCLSSLDDMITAQASKTETLREYKRGLMQQLFPTTF